MCNQPWPVVHWPHFHRAGKSEVSNRCVRKSKAMSPIPVPKLFWPATLPMARSFCTVSLTAQHVARRGFDRFHLFYNAVISADKGCVHRLPSSLKKSTVGQSRSPTSTKISSTSVLVLSRLISCNARLTPFDDRFSPTKYLTVFFRRTFNFTLQRNGRASTIRTAFGSTQIAQESTKIAMQPSRINKKRLTNSVRRSHKCGKHKVSTVPKVGLEPTLPLGKLDFESTNFEVKNRIKPSVLPSDMNIRVSREIGSN